ncbi:hypothetical protein E2K61_06430 [Escherichia coli]|uniref:hypothetical protein n=1 Tax=Escherichia coli TaxID=562 RepID=UPI0011F1720A|nr:hypothetical protein [Escherichia coli]KAA0607181.1 hypothetical protein E2K70_10115 [Escherichia coli]KAA0670710.1 hypothetical protein E2K61_06430 [Escherichia coli]
MNKKNRPLQAANSDIRVSDVTPLTKSLQAPKRTPKKHRARVYMLRTGINSFMNLRLKGNKNSLRQQESDITA